jgi:fructan beta-fructosidase
MVAMYTQHGEREVQSIAYSLDGVHFTPYEGNPVIKNPGLRDFRDPKVFWDEKHGRWAMALAASDRIEFYTSNDLRSWTKTGEFGRGIDTYGNIFECPDLFPLTAPDGREVWALLVSMAAPAEMGGGRMQSYLGTYDVETFIKLPSHPRPLMVDAGFDDYAGVTYHNTAERIYLGWAASPTYAGKVPAEDYRGMMTLPRRLALVDTDAGWRIAAQPLHSVLDFTPVKDGGALPGGAFEVRIQAEGAFEVSIENRLGEVLRFGVDESNTIYTDRSRSSGAPGASRPTEIREPRRPTNSPPVEGWTAEPDGVVGGAARPMDIPWAGNDLYSITCTPRPFSGICDMRLVMDGPIAELYADGGVYVNTMLVYPTEGYTSVRAAGKVQMQVAKI